MKLIILICISITYLLPLTGQYQPTRPYEKLQLQGFEQNWYHTYFDLDTDSTYIDNYSVFTDYHEIEPIINNGRLFTITNSNRLIKSSNGANYSGYYVTCIDLATGSQIWQYRYKIDQGNKVEIPRFMKIEDDKLKIFGQKQSIEYTGSFSLTDLILFRRNLDLNIGISSYYFESDANNPRVYRTTYPESEMFYQINSNEYTILQITTDSVQNTGFQIITLDSLGRLKEPVRNVHKIYDIYNVVLENVGKDTLLSLETEFVNGINFMVFRYFDISNKFKELEEIKFQYNGYPDYLGSGAVSPDKQKILLNAIVIPSPQIPEPTLRKYIVDLKGKILNIVNRYADGFYQDVNWYENDTVFSTLKWILEDVNGKPIKSSLQLLNIKGDFESTLLKEFKSKDSMRTALPYKFISLNSEDELSLWQEVALNIRPSTGKWQIDPGASAYSIIHHKKSIFNPFISSTDEKFINNSCHIYPNPTENCFSISDKSENGDYEIYNSSGQMVQKGTIESEVCLNNLNSGIYVIKIKSKHREFYSCSKIIKH